MHAQILHQAGEARTIAGETHQMAGVAPLDNVGDEHDAVACLTSDACHATMRYGCRKRWTESLQ